MIRDLLKNRTYNYLFFLTVACAVGFQGWRTLLNNFAVDNVGVNGLWIGILQSVREVPGFLALLVVYFLFIFKEHRLITHFIVILGIGVGLTGFMPSHAGLIITILIMSLGFHYYEALRQSLVLQSFEKHETSLVFGTLNSVTALTNILIGVLIYFVSMFLSMKEMFALLGFSVIIIASITYFKKFPIIIGHPQHKKMILRKKYWLFYVLNFLSGARRQIFVVFSVFLLVQHYRFSVKGITVLFVINNLLNYFIAPVIAKSINRFGERKVLYTEYASLFVIFIAYAFIDSPWIAAFLYILDNVLFNFTIAIKTYFQKVADKSDIASSMAVGFTINHITAVFFPLLGGVFWMYSFKIPFIAGAVLALISLFFVSKVQSY
jgi:hypothetical protein